MHDFECFKFVFSFLRKLSAAENVRCFCVSAHARFTRNAERTQLCASGIAD
jgi:hypothetical protein